MKTVIYKEDGIYKSTTLDNYTAVIKNARLICSWENFNSADEIIDYCIKWCGKKKEQFMIIE
jgi:hypothetical protein